MAFRDWDRVERLENPATWVRRVVINRSVSAIRRRVAATRGLVRLGAADGHVFPVVPAESAHVWEAVARLPKRQRQSVALRYVEQLSLEEIALVLGCSKATVNTHLHRARTTLAQRLGTEDLI